MNNLLITSLYSRYVVENRKEKRLSGVRTNNVTVTVSVRCLSLQHCTCYVCDE